VVYVVTEFGIINLKGKSELPYSRGSMGLLRCNSLCLNDEKRSLTGPEVAFGLADDAGLPNYAPDRRYAP
jgi:hypothetical protein